MVILQAPYPVSTTTCLLPSPQFQDAVSAKQTVDYSAAIDGTPYTYVKRADDLVVLKLDFILTRMKSFELRDFFKAFAGVQWKLINYDDKQYVGYVKTNPLILTPTARSIYSPDTVLGSFEEVTTNFEFEGVLQ